MASSSEKLLLLLLRQGSCSRADLAKSMHLSRPAVSSLVDGLIRQEDGSLRVLCLENTLPGRLRMLKLKNWN